ncbi:MAG TPA: hypothetical protein VLB27_04145 [candidate division Zixibacteria bacterium]|nr:hypothetical protein [candidate division Zixibacteria bacterium]
MSLKSAKQLTGLIGAILPALAAVLTPLFGAVAAEREALALAPERLYSAYVQPSGAVAAVGMTDAEVDTAPMAEKSPFVAAGLSLALPGAGQVYAKNPGQARLFFGLEAATWLGYAGLRMFAEWREDDVLHFAQQHAGITSGPRDDDFLRRLTFYESRDEYNSLGRALDPDFPFIPDDPSLDWSWDSEANQREFRDLFNDKRSADRNAEFMFVAAAANRLVAAALAWREAKRYNAQLRHDDLFGDTSQSRPHTSITFASPGRERNGAGGLTVTLTRSF